MVTIMTALVPSPAIAVPYNWDLYNLRGFTCTTRDGSGGWSDAMAWLWDEARGAGLQCNR